jgi:uncharacterized protein (DUF58 family)
MLDALRGVSWPARFATRGATAGTHKSRLRGSSAEFTEYRAYRQGDDPRRLDWKLLARTDRAFVRITNERATLPTLFILDASASMNFPAEREGKWSEAVAIAVGLAGVAHAAGDPIALAVAGPTVRRIPFRARQGAVNEMARTLGQIEPAGTSSLAPLLRQPGRAARIVLLTDLLGDADPTLRAARQLLITSVDVVLVHLVAPEELDPPAGTVLAEDPESPATRRPLTPLTRETYRDRFTAWRQDIARDWIGAGARYVLVRSDESPEGAVRRIVGP